MGVALVGLAVLVTEEPASADTFVVTRFDDPAPTACDPGDCSLREAIIDANAASGGPHTIELAAGTYVIEQGPVGGGEATGDFDLDTSVTIVGQGSGAGGTVVDARPSAGSSPLDRVFQVHSGTVVLEDLQITGGDSSADPTDFGGGGIDLLPGADVTLRDVVVTGNRAATTGLVATNDGGGVKVNQASLTVEDSRIEGNSVEHASVAAGGGIGILPDGPATVSIVRSTLADNVVTTTGSASVASGGAIAIGNGTVTMDDSTADGNHVVTTGLVGSEAAGGAVSLLAGSFSAERSTFSDNVAEGTAASSIAHGGGIVSAGGVLTIENSTISGNAATALAAAEGGGLNSANSVDLVFTTVTGNQAVAGAGIFRTGAGSATRLEGSIVADNVGADCGGTNVTSQGHNLDSDFSCNFLDPTDVPGGVADLQPLDDNGGPTRTHALGSSSEATDAGGDCDGTVAVDQRGTERPQANACDIGSFEAVPPPPPTTTTTSPPPTTTTTTSPPPTTTTTTAPPSSTSSTTSSTSTSTTSTSTTSTSTTTTTRPGSTSSSPTTTSSDPTSDPPSSPAGGIGDRGDDLPGDPPNPGDPGPDGSPSDDGRSDPADLELAESDPRSEAARSGTVTSGTAAERRFSGLTLTLLGGGSFLLPFLFLLFFRRRRHARERPDVETAAAAGH